MKDGLVAKRAYDFETSQSYIEKFTIPPTKPGILDGLTFGVKDNIDVAGHKTGYG